MKYNNIVLHIPHSSFRFPVKNYINKYWAVPEMASTEMWDLIDIDSDIIFGTQMKDVKSIIFPYSRFYCDVERLVDDPLEKEGQGIIYKSYKHFYREVNENEKEKIYGIYNSHIDKLKSLINENTLVIDCHTFSNDKSNIDICIGYNEDWSKPDKWVIDLIKNECESRGLKVGINTPFANSISPLKDGIPYHSIMLELNKRTYMLEEEQIPFNKRILKHFLKYLYKKILTYEN